jgi:hypothetical protein
MRAHNDQSDGGWNHRPQEHVAELRAGLRVREDAVRVVVDICRDEARPHDSKEEQEPEFPTSQEFHAQWI